MANEITVNLSLSGYKASVMAAAVARSVTNYLFSMSGTTYIEGSVSVATSATAIPLGSVTAPHWAFFYNTDTTNFIRIRNGAGGSDLMKLKPLEVAVCPLYDSAVPYAIADTAACLLEYLIFSL